jgi:polyisoprenoid-binding protein YceI
VLAALPAIAADLPFAAGKSTVSVEFRQMNVPVSAVFKQFRGSADFDPAAPASAKASIDIDTASFDLGDEDYNSEVRKPEWLDTVKFPKAGFTAAGLKALGGGKYAATGTLSLKGKTEVLTVPLTVSSSPGGAVVFDGEVPLSRSTFNIGDAQWKDTVADQVIVKFHIVAAAH